MSVLKLIILVVLTVIMALAGYHFWGLYGAVIGTGAGILLIVLGGRI